MTNMLLSPPTRPLTKLVLYVQVYITLLRLLDKLIRYWQLTWQSYICSDHTHERGNPGQSWVCFVLLWNFNQIWRTGSTSLYWIPKLHKCPYKQCYIAGSAKCPTKPLSKLLTSIPSAVKTGFQSYCDTS